ncbi:MAG: XRE family transcriptional regulator [Leptolyngbya sp. RL_3_1]|nr:XRE family transcriptional regulator [Leptolyngbya sp. RL_3_1]
MLATYPQLSDKETLAFAIAEAESLKIRTDLMLEVQHYIRYQGWNAEEAALALRQTLPQMQNLLNGEISRFTAEQLIQILCRLGRHVQIMVTD